MLNDKIFNINKMKLLIIDEADELLSIGFEEQLRNIIETFDNKIQIGLFSATLSDKCLLLTKYFMNDPINIFVKTDELTFSYKSILYKCEKEEWKLDVLMCFI